MQSESENVNLTLGILSMQTKSYNVIKLPLKVIRYVSLLMSYTGILVFRRKGRHYRLARRIPWTAESLYLSRKRRKYSLRKKPIKRDSRKRSSSKRKSMLAIAL